MDPRVLPDVCPVPAKLSELDVVPVGPFALAENQNQLVLRAIEASHAAVVFNPHAQVEELVVILLAGGDQISHMPPINTDEMNRALRTVLCQHVAEVVY